MRARVRTGLVLLALALALTGCNQAKDSQPGASPGTGQSSRSVGDSTSSSSEYVLTVEGMV
jgi:hypothetical protein